ncbi:MAG: hypothetical protein JXA57_17490 [Armatimonadetes bacterium]|nr:hypothetical protein [Armatimonadota bacterium]
MYGLLLNAVTLTVALFCASMAAANDESPSVTVSERYGQSCRGTVDGLPVLVLRGTHRERGEAHGFLGAREIVKTCDAMALSVNAMFGETGEAAGWERAKKLMGRFQFPPRFEVELAGMLEGIHKALPNSCDRTLKATGAEIAFDDLKMLQCGDTLELMQCSQFSAWGSFTPDGSTIVGRNWDYPPIFPHDTYCAFAVDPAEEGLQRTLDAMWFGMIGAGMACLNEEQVYVSGNDAGREDPSLVEQPTPGALAMRTVGETTSANDPLAAMESIVDQKTALALLYHIVAPASDGNGSQAFVFEHAPGATAPFAARVRSAPATRPEALVVTNDPLIGGRPGAEVCERFAAIEAALDDPATKASLDFERARAILDAVAKAGATQYSAVVFPEKREIRFAVAPSSKEPATKQHYSRLQWNILFDLH